jgi:hypothetical protein
MREVAAAVVDALKTQPAVLALTIANLALLGFIYYALAGAAETRGQLVAQILANSSAIHEMLSQRAIACPDPGR